MKIEIEEFEHGKDPFNPSLLRFVPFRSFADEFTGAEDRVIRRRFIASVLEEPKGIAKKGDRNRRVVV
jgi:hypothetical protein